MNSFKIFQTDTAVLKRIETDGAGDETVADSFSVEVDPTFEWQRVFTRENEETRGAETIVTGDNLQPNFDFTHRKWKLEYNGHEYNVESPVPFYTIGTNNLEHIQITLT